MTLAGSAFGGATLAGTGEVDSDPSAALEGVATLTANAVRTVAGAAALQADATLVADTTSRFGSAVLQADASLSASGVVVNLSDASLSADASLAVAALVLKIGAGALSANALLDADSELYKQAVNPPIGTFDAGNTAVFSLTVAGTPVDTSDPYFRPDSLEVTYAGKEMTFSEVATPGIGSPTFAPEQNVTLDIDLGAGFFRWFTGAIRVRETIGINNQEGFRYTAFGYQNLADEHTAIGSDGKPNILFTVGTTITSIASGNNEVVQSFSKTVREAITEVFSFNASSLNTLGIPTLIGSPGLETFSADLPETLRLQNRGFSSAITEIAGLETGVKVFFNDVQQAWTFPNLLQSPTARINIASTNVPELIFDKSTEGRYTAVQLYADVDDLLDNAIETRTQSLNIGGRNGYITQTQISLAKKWPTELEVDWTIHKARQGYLAPELGGGLENDNFWVYKRWTIPNSAPEPWPGTPVSASQKFDFWGVETWKRTHGRAFFTRRREFVSRFHLIHRGNPHVPGDVIGPLEVVLSYIPKSFTFNFNNDSGTPVSTTIDGSEFPTDIRVPESGFTGTAFTEFGVERLMRRVVSPTEVTSANANALLRLHKDVVITGELPMEGDPVRTLVNLDRKVQVRHPTISTGVETLSAFLTGYSYEFGKRGLNNIELTTDVAGLIVG